VAGKFAWDDAGFFGRGFAVGEETPVVRRIRLLRERYRSKAVVPVVAEGKVEKVSKVLFLMVLRRCAVF
jgi:hypothetical protein